MGNVVRIKRKTTESGERGTLAEQLAEKVSRGLDDFKPTNSNPRCLCHNLSLETCPGKGKPRPKKARL